VRRKEGNCALLFCSEECCGIIMIPMHNLLNFFGGATQ
jgi:hypothetical protein